MKETRTSFILILVFVATLLTAIATAFARDNRSSATPRPAGEPLSRTAASVSGQPMRAQDADFFRGVIVVKFKPQVNVLGKLTSRNAINQKMAKYGVHALDQAFPFLERSSKKRAATLRRVYYLEYASGAHPLQVISPKMRPSHTPSPFRSIDFSTRRTIRCSLRKPFSRSWPRKQAGMSSRARPAILSSRWSMAAPTGSMKTWPRTFGLTKARPPATA